MSTGKIHAFATAAAGGVMGPVLVILGHAPVAAAVTFSAGCMAGLLINPDLDIRHGTHAEQVVRLSAGRFLAGLWYALWWPYARLIPRHRHPLSHFPVVGTVVRILYLWAVLGLLWLLAGLMVTLPVFPAPMLAPDNGLWWALSGLVLVDALHAFMDII